MADPFKRMHERLAARLGSEAFLRGETPCKVDIEHGVEVYGEQGNIIGVRTVIDILTPDLNPKTGNALQVGDKAYRLDRLFKNDGYSSRWIVLEA